MYLLDCALRSGKPRRAGAGGGGAGVRVRAARALARRGGGRHPRRDIPPEGAEGAAVRLQPQVHVDRNQDAYWTSENCF